MKGRDRSGSSSRPRPPGFSLVEVLVVLVVSLTIVAGIYRLLIGENRLYSKQTAVMDVRASLRAAGALLAVELRQVSASAGDLYAIDEHALALRSIRGTGYLCAAHATQPRAGLWGVSGDFETTAVDSALVFAIGEKGRQDDEWRVVALTGSWQSGGGVPSCNWWSGTPATELVIEYAGSLDSVHTGAPVRAFRKVEYGLYQEDGRWWLGRKVANAASYEKLGGPLSPPADSGLVFIYYDWNGVPTSTAGEVAMVDVVLRGESLRKAPQPKAPPDFVQDSLTLRVWLRNGS